VEYYYKRKTHQTSWVPPAPNFSASDQDNDVNNTNIHHSQVISSFFVQPPTTISTEGSSTLFVLTIREQVQAAPHKQ
jgi:hypothetical protein